MSDDLERRVGELEHRVEKHHKMLREMLDIARDRFERSRVLEEISEVTFAQARGILDHVTEILGLDDSNWRKDDLDAGQGGG